MSLQMPRGGAAGGREGRLRSSVVLRGRTAVVREDSEEGGARAPLTWVPLGKQMLHQHIRRALEELPNLLSILGKLYRMKRRPEMRADLRVCKYLREDRGVVPKSFKPT